MRRLLLFLLFTLMGFGCSDLLLMGGQPASGTHPIIEASATSDNFFGGMVDGKWVEGETLWRKLKGGERYRLYSATQYLGNAAGGKPEYDPNEPGSPNVSITLPKGTPDQAMIIGVGGDWNALPRTPKVEKTAQPVYREAIHTILTQHKLPKAPIIITRIFRIDLDGDGTEEVLIATSSMSAYNWTKHEPGKQDYSLVLLRKLVKGKVVSMPIASCFFNEGQDQVGFTIYTLQAVLDVNGDGILEPIISWNYGEGDGTTIYQIDGTKAECVLSNGWGV